MPLIKILDHEFTVDFRPDSYRRSELGYSSLKDSVIWVDGGMSMDNKSEILLHECIHMISDMLYLELTESQVSGVAMGVYSLLKNNKLEVPYAEDNQKDIQGT